MSVGNYLETNLVGRSRMIMSQGPTDCELDQHKEIGFLDASTDY